MSGPEGGSPIASEKYYAEFVVVIITICGVIYGVWASRWELNINAATKHLGLTCQDDNEMGYFLPNFPPFWKHYFWWFWPLSAIPPPKIPSLADIIKAGDDGIFTSGMIDNLKSEPLNVSWKPIYEAVFREYAWALDQERDKEKAKALGNLRRIGGIEDQDIKRYRKWARYDVWKTKRVVRGARLWENAWPARVLGWKRMARLQYWVHDLGRRLRRTIFPCIKEPDLRVLIKRDPNAHSIANVDPHLLYYPWKIMNPSDEGDDEASLQSRDESDSEWGETESQKDGFRNIDPILASSIRVLPSIGGGDAKPFHRKMDLRPIWIHQGSPAIELSEEALAALGFFLGIELQGKPGSYLPNGRGGFGLCLTSNTFKAMTVLRMVYGSRGMMGTTMGGKGYTTLFARNLACGCLPFARGTSDDNIETLGITKKVEQLVKDGLAISDVSGTSDTWDWQEPRLRMLEHMPSPGAINYYSQGLPPDTEDTQNHEQHSTSVAVLFPNGSSSPRSLVVAVADGHTNHHHSEPTDPGIGTIWTVHWKTKQRTLAGTWWEAVAGIAFGGLAPMSTQLLVDVVDFSIGTPVSESEEHMRHDMFALAEIIRLVSDRIKNIGGGEIYLFGKRFAKRMNQVGSGRFLDYGSRALGVYDDTMTGIVQTFAVYSTLLEALIAMVLGPDSGNPFETARWKRDMVFNACAGEIKETYMAAVEHERQRVPHGERVRIADLLDGKHIKEALLRKPPNAITAAECGTVARCIIMAWTRLVRIVDWQIDRPKGRQTPQGQQVKEELNIVFGTSGDLQIDQRAEIGNPSGEESNSGTEGVEGVHGDRVASKSYPPMSLEDLPDVAAWE